MTATTLATVLLNTVAPIPCQVASVETETVSTTQTPSVTDITPTGLIVMPTPTKTLTHSGQATELHTLSSGKFYGTETADTSLTESPKQVTKARESSSRTTARCACTRVFAATKSRS